MAIEGDDNDDDDDDDDDDSDHVIVTSSSARRHQRSGVNPYIIIISIIIIIIIIRRNRSYSASDSAYSYTFLRSVVCLSVVCHIRAPCVNRSTDLDAIWQVQLWSPMTHCVGWGLGEGKIWGL